MLSHFPRNLPELAAFLRQFLAITLFLTTVATSHGAKDALPEVLVLLSRNPSDTWATAELDGILLGLRSGPSPVAATVEWMDWQGTSGVDYDQYLLSYYAKKYAQHRVRVVMGADEPALTFLLAHRDALFPQAQVVFSGVMKAEDSFREGRPWLTGVVEDGDPAATVRMAMSLQPKLSRLYILEDSTMSGAGVKRRIERDMPEESKRILLELLRADTAQALFTAVEHLPPDSAVLLTRSRVARRMLTEFRARCPVPIYGQRSPAHLDGMVAGALVDGGWHGEAAGRLALRLLAGESAANISLVRDVPLRIVADFREMNRFGFSFAVLPPEVEILNRPLNVWNEYPTLAITIAAALASLTVLVLLLGSALRQKRRAADALKNSLSLLNATFDATADGVLAVDSAGKVTGYNHQFLTLWRIPPELAARRDDGALLSNVVGQLRNPELFLKRVQQLYATPEAESFDFIEFKDGRIFERRSRPQRLEGRIVGRVWNFADITERRRGEQKHRKLEAELAHAHKLEALGTLAGGIAHDFNNLLTAIIGYTQLGRDALPPDHPVRTDLEVVLSASDRARDLVQQILMFSRKGPAEHRYITLNSVVKDAVRLLRASVPASIDLRCEIRDVEHTVLADGSQVNQAILNLGGNAAHALGRQSGQITIRLEPVEVNATVAREQPQLREGRFVCLSVIDTGQGMDAETLPRIFDPFFTTKEPGEGTGLGLAVVHGIMKGHNGAVTVESTLGAGTTFRLYFPEVEAPASGNPAPLVVAATTRNESLLVIDDDAKVLHVTERLLQSLGYDVTACRGPEGALEVLRTRSAEIDGVVTDLNMPKMSGLEFTAELRRICPEMPVVLVTGFLGDGEVEQQAGELGIEEVVEKPFTSGTLGTAVRTALDREQTARPTQEAA
jgi:signal transduction histidine kinase/ActR/RegA family two-component response regulator